MNHFSNKDLNEAEEFFKKLIGQGYIRDKLFHASEEELEDKFGSKGGYLHDFLKEKNFRNKIKVSLEENSKKYGEVGKENIKQAIEELFEGELDIHAWNVQPRVIQITLDNTKNHINFTELDKKNNIWFLDIDFTDTHEIIIPKSMQAKRSNNNTAAASLSGSSILTKNQLSYEDYI